MIQNDDLNGLMAGGRKSKINGRAFPRVTGDG